MIKKINGPLVEVTPGVYSKKPWGDLAASDRIVFGAGPQAQEEASRMEREIDAMIEKSRRAKQPHAQHEPAHA